MSQLKRQSMMKNNPARDQALQARDAFKLKPTSLVGFNSAGRIIAVGEDAALKSCDHLPKSLNLNRVSSSGDGSRIQISGYLGEYVVSLTDKQGNVTSSKADAILDLHAQPIINREMLPAGYFHVSVADLGNAELIEELENLQGEFDKPRYFEYDPSICAHGVNGKIACRQCIDACPAEAIQSLGERIEVNSHLCQGGGSCTTVCPSGAIRYLYPNIRDNGQRLREMLRVYREQGGARGVVVFHADSYNPDSYLQEYDNLLPVRVEELASVGMDLCLSALVYGAAQVVLLVDEEVPSTSLANLDAQLDWLQAILAGLGLDPLCVATCSVNSDIADVGSGCSVEVAIYDMPDSKRNAIFQALDHLVNCLHPELAEVELPASAPFGDVVIDAAKCTLCMACVGACPGKALQDGSNREVPEVFFIENQCLQCTGCVITCPEQAVTLMPRIIFDRETRNRSRSLNSDTPFACISCGKAFAPTSVINKMQEKLKDHYMFSNARALDRLKMCEDCRVVDIVEDPEAFKGQFDPLDTSRH